MVEYGDRAFDAEFADRGPLEDPPPNPTPHPKASTPRTPEKPTTEERPVKSGTCCACGCEDDEEVVCPIRKDGNHCAHYWDVRLADE